MGLKNIEAAADSIVKFVDFDENLKSPVPVTLSPSDLFKFTIEPNKHQHYANLWLGLTFTSVFSNMFLWLYL